MGFYQWERFVKDRELFEKSAKALQFFAKKTSAPTLQNLLYELEDRIAELKEQEGRYKMCKESRDKLRMALEGNTHRWNPELDAPYQEIKRLVATGVQVTCACKAIGLSTDQYYRRKRIEMRGGDRK